MAHAQTTTDRELLPAITGLEEAALAVAARPGIGARKAIGQPEPNIDGADRGCMSRHLVRREANERRASNNHAS
jgi:hypothetical protein